MRIVNSIARICFCIVVALLIPVGVHGLADQMPSSNSSSGIGVKGGYETYSAGSFSSDGRFVAFDSDAADLVAGDTNGKRDVFVKDRQTGTMTRVSKSSSGVQGNGVSEYASISADGRYVAFFSYASTLVAGDTNGRADIFVHNRDTGTTTLVSRNSSGALGNQISLWPSISADGTYVTFNSHATNLVPGDPGNIYPDVFLRNLQTDTTTLLAQNISGGYGNIGTYVPTSISSDNRYVAFWATSTNLVPGDTNGYSDVFVRDRGTDTTELISVSTAGVQGNGRSEVPAISLDGRYVAFQSLATNLVAGDTNGRQDIFVRDRETGTTTLVSKNSSGGAGNYNSGTPAISADGRYVAFFSSATNLVSGDTNGYSDVFVHDRQTGTTSRVSVSTAGVQGNSNSLDAFISPDGRYVGFYSDASNLVANDTNGRLDIFVRDLVKGTTRSLTIPEPAPVADFTANITSGDSPLGVQFTDTSTGNPTSWNWSFGDGEYSEVQNPSHAYIIADSYDVSLTVEKDDGSDTETKPDYISVTCPYSCDMPDTEAYINFVIWNVSCPYFNSGIWRNDTNCYDNAVIRWARAGNSVSFSTNLSPLMWKRDRCCPNPGHSYAVDSPFNKPIYIAAINNMDADVYYSHHAVDAEFLSAGNVSNSTWEDWNFFQYHEPTISIGWGHQISNGTSSFWTDVWIKEISSIVGCGQYDGLYVRKFYIDQNGTPQDHPRDRFTSGYLKNQMTGSRHSEIKVPDKVNEILVSMTNERPFTINQWKYDTIKKELVVYVFDIKDEHAIKNYETKPVDDYSIRIIHDSDFEITRANVRQELEKLSTNPAYQIAGISMITDRIDDPPGNYVELWVYKSTPENKNLDDTIVSGWKIKVYPMTPPPLNTGDSKK